MSYPLIAGDINKGGHTGTPPCLLAPLLAKDLPPTPNIRLKWALSRRQLNIPKFPGENIPLQASHLPHALI